MEVVRTAMAEYNRHHNHCLLSFCHYNMVSEVGFQLQVSRHDLQDADNSLGDSRQARKTPEMLKTRYELQRAERHLPPAAHAVGRIRLRFELPQDVTGKHKAAA